MRSATNVSSRSAGRLVRIFVLAAFACALLSVPSLSSAAVRKAPSARPKHGPCLRIALVGCIPVDKKLAARLPAQFKNGIVVATDAPFPPFESLVNNGKTLAGMDIDLSRAVAEVLGTKAIIQNVPFSGMVPGLLAGKYDMLASGIGDIKGRGDQMNFVMYDTSPGTVLIIPSSNPHHITTWADMCGLSVAAESGSHDVTLIPALSSHYCSGKSGITVQALPTAAAQVLAVQSGKADALSSTAFFGGMLPKGKFKVVDDPDERAVAAQLGVGQIRQGLAISKQQPALSALVYKAALQLSREGFWSKIISRWGLAHYKLDPPLYNKPIP